jgi:DnaD/phage-associated family protein
VARRKLRFKLKQKPGEKGIFLPESVLSSLADATEAELKLLVLIAKEGRDKDYLSESELMPIAEKAGIDKISFTEAMAFFRGAGFVENEDLIKETLIPPITAEEEKIRYAKKGTNPYTSLQLAEASSTPEFRELIEFASRRLGKTFNTGDIATLYSFVDSLLLPYAVIMLGIEHCVTEGKTSLRYVEKLLIDFADKEINTYEKAEEYIRVRVLYKSFEGKIRVKLGLGQRSLTSKEKAMLSDWQNKFCTPDPLLDLAYEKTVEKTGKASMSYMNKILENWHTQGFKTVEDVEKGDNRTDDTSSFNPDDFFSVAVSRTKNKTKEQDSER